MTDPLIDSLRKAVDVSPDDTRLRLHLAELLLWAGEVDDAIAHCATVLAQDPTSVQARRLMARAMTPDESHGEPQPGEFDWSAAEHEMGGIAAAMFVTGDDAQPEPATSAWEVEDAGVTLADVGGLQEVKDRLEAAFLAPLRNPELRKLFGKSLRGGLLLYGPPGCGKTFIAKAVAGEMGAKFISVGLSEVLDMWMGNSEKNVRELFLQARRSAPVVLFIDEVDALGQKRSQTRSSAMRGTVNQLLAELDGVGSDNEGVYVLAATNQPWDVDPALRRPGRLDRTVLVLPPTSRPGRRSSSITSRTGRSRGSICVGWPR